MYSSVCRQLVGVVLVSTVVWMGYIVSLSPLLSPFLSKDSNYELCLLENYGVDLLEHVIPERMLDRSSRSSHLASLNKLADEVGKQYIRDLELGSAGVLPRLSPHSHPCVPVPLIYECSYECGGLGDRLKGLTSTFYLALLTNARFYYSWTFPNDVNSYFTASETALESPAEKARSLFGIKYLFMYEWWCMNRHCMNRDRDNQRTTSGRLNELWNGYDSVVSHTNMAYWDILVKNPHLAATARRYNLHLLRQDEMFFIFTRLYFSRPTEFMQLALIPFTDITEQNDIFKIGVQLRIGNDTPEWRESARHSYESVGCLVEKVQWKCKEQDNGRKCLVFVTSDSDKAIAIFRERLSAAGIPMYVSNGTISHIDKPSNKILAGNVMVEHARVFIDWYLLTKLDFLYISRSGFGETAAFAGLVPAEQLALGRVDCTTYKWDGDAGSKLW